MADDQKGITLPLRRDCGDDAEAIGVAPTHITISTSRQRRKADGSIECECEKCGVYFSEAELHTVEMCELSQIMND